MDMQGRKRRSLLCKGGFLIVMRLISKIVWHVRPVETKGNTCTLLAHAALTMTWERARMCTAKPEGETKTGAEIKLVETKPEGKTKMGVKTVVQGNAQGKTQVTRSE
eukprot:13408602-Ditylum_brightwellii.AAC.1